MFNEIRKMIFLSKSKTIPQKLSVFTNNLTHIEAASVNEIEQFLSDAIKLESFILSYKGKMSDYLHLYYFNAISHLKEDLIDLYENKTKDVLSSEDIIENEESITDIKKICQRYNDTKLKDVKKKHKKPKKVRRRRSKRRALPKVRPARKKIGKSLKIKTERIIKKIHTRVMNSLNNLKKPTFLRNDSKTKSKKIGSSLRIFGKEKINLFKNKSKRTKNSTFMRKTLKPVIVASTLFIGMGVGIKSSSVEVEADNLLSNNTNDIVDDYDENAQYMFKSDTELMVEELINTESVQIEDENIEVIYNSVSSNDIFVEENTSYQEVEEVSEIVEEEIVEVDNLVEDNTQIEESIDLEESVKLQIGKEISLVDGCHSYSNMYDAYFNENTLNPAYGNGEVERKIKTIIVSNGETLKNVSTNEELENYCQNGYEIIGCSVTNQYSTNGSVEGYYRLDDIKVNEYQKVLK